MLSTLPTLHVQLPSSEDISVMCCRGTMNIGQTGQLKVIPLFRYSVFHILPTPQVRHLLLEIISYLITSNGIIHIYIISKYRHTDYHNVLLKRAHLGTAIVQQLTTTVIGAEPVKNKTIIKTLDLLVPGLPRFYLPFVFTIIHGSGRPANFFVSPIFRFHVLL